MVHAKTVQLLFKEKGIETLIEKVRLLFILHWKVDEETKFIPSMNRPTGFIFEGYSVEPKTLRDFMYGMSKRPNSFQSMLTTYITWRYCEKKMPSNMRTRPEIKRFLEYNDSEIKKWIEAFKIVVEGTENLELSETENDLESLRTALPEPLRQRLREQLKSFNDEFKKALNALESKRFVKQLPQASSYVPKLTISSANSTSGKDFQFEHIPFVGRDDELETIDKFLGQKNAFLCAQIAGESGVGKTRLAIEACKNALKKKWKAGILSTADLETLEEDETIRQEFFQEKMLVVLDGIQGREIRIRKLLEKVKDDQEQRRKQLDSEIKKVRFIIINKLGLLHVLDTQSDDELGYEFKQLNKLLASEDFKGYWYEEKPIIELDKMRPELLVSIVKSLVQPKDEKNAIDDEEIKSRLKRINPLSKPEIATYLGLYWNDSEDSDSIFYFFDQIIERGKRERLLNQAVYLDATINERELALIITAQATIMGRFDVDNLVAKVDTQVPSKSTRRLAATYTESRNELKLNSLYGQNMLGRWFVIHVIDSIGLHNTSRLLDVCWRLAPKATLQFLKDTVFDMPYSWEIDAFLSRSQPPKDVFDTMGFEWYALLKRLHVQKNTSSAQGKFNATTQLARSFLPFTLLIQALHKHHRQAYWKEDYRNRVCNIAHYNEAKIHLLTAYQSNLPAISLLYQLACQRLTHRFLYPDLGHISLERDNEHLYWAKAAFTAILQVEELNEAHIGLGIIAYLLNEPDIAFEELKKGLFSTRKWRFKKMPFYNVDNAEDIASNKLFYVWVDISLHADEIDYEFTERGLSNPWIYEDGSVHYPYPFCVIARWLINTNRMLTEPVTFKIKPFQEWVQRQRSELQRLKDRDNTFFLHCLDNFRRLLLKVFEKGKLRHALVVFAFILEIDERQSPVFSRSLVYRCQLKPLDAWHYATQNTYSSSKGLSLDEFLSIDAAYALERSIHLMKEASSASSKEIDKFVEQIQKIEIDKLTEVLARYGESIASLQKFDDFEDDESYNYTPNM